MSRRRKRSDDAWKRAKNLCGLSTSQVDMGRRLGLNPTKLPGLIPTSSEPWKRPVGEYIEELHAERFGVEKAEPRPAMVVSPEKQDSAREMNQVEDLAVYFAIVADDLGAWAAHGEIPKDLVPTLISELRVQVYALVAGAPASRCSEIPSPPHPEGERRPRPEDDPDWEDVPF